MKVRCPLIALTTLFAILGLSLGLKADDCEVCKKVLSDFMKVLSKEEKNSTKAIEEAFRRFCKKVTSSKDQRFCYFLGGTEDAATGMLREISAPISSHFPVERICEKLTKKDRQICELRYEKEIDLKSVDLKKLKVRDLKKILSNWGEICEGCLEKSEFILMIEELKPQYVKNEL